jgi:hypothetical protein
MLSLLAACAAPAPRPAPAPAPPIAVSLRVEVLGPDGQERAVAPDETLYSRDAIRLRVRVDRPAHLYVVQFFALGVARRGLPLQRDAEDPGV